MNTKDCFLIDFIEFPKKRKGTVVIFDRGRNIFRFCMFEYPISHAGNEQYY
jgi:hypothetical protein